MHSPRSWTGGRPTGFPNRSSPLQAGARSRPETPASGDPRLARRRVGIARSACAGLTPTRGARLRIHRLVVDTVTGEHRTRGFARTRVSALVRELPRPVCVLSSGILRSRTRRRARGTQQSRVRRRSPPDELGPRVCWASGQMVSTPTTPPARPWIHPRWRRRRGRGCRRPSPSAHTIPKLLRRLGDLIARPDAHHRRRPAIASSADGHSISLPVDGPVRRAGNWLVSLNPIWPSFLERRLRSLRTTSGPATARDLSARCACRRERTPFSAIYARARVRW